MRKQKQSKTNKQKKPKKISYRCVKSSPIEEISPSSVQVKTLYLKFTSTPIILIYLGRSDEGLTLETSALKLFIEANLRYQLS